MSFKSWRSYWEFSNAVHTKNRYILDSESKNFLKAIVDTCENRVRVIKKGSVLWRAQIGHSVEPIYSGDIHVDDEPVPFPPLRMKPLDNSASEGRANPKGIPSLYVATTKETAMSEVRPWLGSIISAGQFEVQRELRIIDFSVEHGKNNLDYFFKKPSDEETLKAVWSEIDNAFSRPTESSDLKSEYAPTQIISEFIKSKGFDGIAYKSSLADGHNCALFDLDSAKLINCSIYSSKKIKFDFSEINNPYFVKS